MRVKKKLQMLSFIKLEAVCIVEKQNGNLCAHLRDYVKDKRKH